MRRVVLTPAAARRYKRLGAGVRSMLKQMMAECLGLEEPTLQDRNRSRVRRLLLA